MRRVWKIAISIVLIIVLGGAGTAYYFFKVKKYNVADKKVEEITTSEYDIILPGENGSSEIEEKIEEAQNKTNNNKSEIEKNIKAQSKTNNNDKSHTSTIAPINDSSQSSTNHQKNNSKELSIEGNKTGNQQKEVTVASIKQKYRPSFEYLQIQANNKIDSLVAQAYTEYQEKKKNGESISFPYFYQKYSSASRVLEKNTDAAFNTILNALQNELKKNGFSASHANSFKEEYESTKKAREADLINKAKEAF
ncbi:hypothetical protein C0966_12725 [Bacillus methanolicus]|uniref:hypothetical protein n=1 Tax=Bacillus methanolicus TaxID=1471 RepID=UPI0023809AEC|nr:hypothetical protein [Bacillus methanolicus]MDE3840211.1 hypothetical protein [Bacillus methanolicus]